LGREPYKYEQVQWEQTDFATQMNDEKRLVVLHSASETLNRHLPDFSENSTNRRSGLVSKGQKKEMTCVVKKVYGIE